MPLAGELLGAAAAIDLDGVDGAPAPSLQIGVVARVPDHPFAATLAERLVVSVAAREGVGLAAAEQGVGPALPEEVVLAGLAEQLVDTGTAGEDVVAGAAGQVRPWQRTVRLVEARPHRRHRGRRLDQRGVGESARRPQRKPPRR